jgi:RNA-binding protein Luc7-like 2
MNIINELGEHIGTKLAKAEELGNTGEVEESMNLFKEVDELKAKKTELEVWNLFFISIEFLKKFDFFQFEFRNSMPASTYQQQKLRVCDVCSAYLGIHDNDRRLADHFGGKLHLGFIQLREKLDELRVIY